MIDKDKMIKALQSSIKNEMKEESSGAPKSSIVSLSNNPLISGIQTETKTNTKEIRILSEDFDTFRERLYDNELEKIEIRKDIKGV